METLNIWFHLLFSSPEYLLLGLIALLGLLGLIGGISDPGPFSDAADRPLDGKDQASVNTWWERDAQHYKDWNAHQVREEHRIARHRCPSD